jgi:CRISPR-associated protein Cas1
MSELMPARMVNEVAYCPRLFALEHLAGEWADNVHTVEGRVTHRRVDTPTTVGLPEPEDDPDRPKAVRSVLLGDPELGMIARIDLVEVNGREVVPVDYKKGEAPDVPEGAWEPERVQVCAQALLLRAHGYVVPKGVLYFAGSKRRVDVHLTEALIQATLAHRDAARAILEGGALPPPLIDSPKCRGCSLVGICLPDEHAVLTGARDEEVRPLIPARDDAVPLHVQLQYGNLRMKAGEIIVREGDREVGRARIHETSQVIVWGNVSLTTPLLHELASRDIPVAMHGFGGWYHGSVVPASGHNVLSRIAQHRAAADPERALAIARAIVEAKIRNQRTLLRRNGRDLDARVLGELKDGVEQSRLAPNVDVLRGVEGNAARVYFQALPTMLRADLGDAFRFDHRNRRPPRDPINCLLSFAYACLARECTHAARSVGLDPFVGFLHVPRHGRPALALDLMEEFRPLIADSVVLNAVNNGVVKEADFLMHPTGVALKPEGKKRFLHVLERRLDELATHPTLSTRLSYRRMLELQARLLAKVVLGEIPTYPGFTVR